MSESYGFIGRVTIPKSKLKAYRETEVDPTAFEDWLDDWIPDDPEDADYSLNADDIFDECSDLSVNWRADGMDFKGVADSDSDVWLTHRITLVALVRLASEFGGSGELVIADAGGGDEEAWRATASPDGTNEFELLDGEEAEDVLNAVSEL
ncbi:MAG: hypothetical protein KC492_27645 [Myxococcales bacterium]|nr:hypothetical protein [Myxococcales bacterium]MCB9608290.1 hypothetical protein [Polyangiaceae bacterium]